MKIKKGNLLLIQIAFFSAEVHFMFRFTWRNKIEKLYRELKE